MFIFSDSYCDIRDTVYKKWMEFSFFTCFSLLNIVIYKTNKNQPNNEQK